MLEKIIVPHIYGIPEVNVIMPSDHFGVKCARDNSISACGRKPFYCGGTCATKQANEDLKEFVRNLKPDPKYLYLHIIAMGSGEYFGPNTNGDYFPEEGLLRKYDTFRTFAHLFKHHVNKDPKQSYGHVPYSTYNEPMRRVELIVAVDRAKAPDIVGRAENGESLGFSMACKIPWDRCSVCNNKAHKKSEYCDHIKHHLLEIMSDGKQSFMVNEDPTFFDISYVLKPADKTAIMLNKVANHETHVKNARFMTYGELDDLAKGKNKTQESKSGSIQKEFETILEPAISEEQQEGIYKYVMPLLKEAEPDLPVDNFKGFPLSDILSTLGLCGIVCKPREYKRILIVIGSDGNNPQIDHGNFNDSIYQLIKHIIPERSFYNPHVEMRLLRLHGKSEEDLVRKEADSYVVKSPQAYPQQDNSFSNKLLALGALGGGAYAAYQTELGKKLLKGIANMIEKKPGKFLLIAGLGTMALESVPILRKQMVTDSLMKYQNGSPYGIEGIIVNTKQSSCLQKNTQILLKRAMDPFGVIYLKKSFEKIDSQN